jgi:hypothetical protein
MLTTCCINKRKPEQPYTTNKDTIVNCLILLFERVPEVTIDQNILDVAHLCLLNGINNTKSIDTEERNNLYILIRKLIKEENELCVINAGRRDLPFCMYKRKTNFCLRAFFDLIFVSQLCDANGSTMLYLCSMQRNFFVCPTEIH